MHAAGVVIGDKPLWEYVPVFQPPGENGSSPSSPRTRSRRPGLVKFDFLGLKTLTVIQIALDLVNRERPPERAQLERAPASRSTTPRSTS